MGIIGLKKLLERIIGKFKSIMYSSLIPTLFSSFTACALPSLNWLALLHTSVRNLLLCTKHMSTLIT